MLQYGQFHSTKISWLSWNFVNPKYVYFCLILLLLRTIIIIEVKNEF